MQSIVKKIIWACLIIIPFVALYVASGHSLDIINWGTAGLYFPFIAGKNLLFRFLVEIAFFSWVILALKDATYRINIRKSPILLAYGIFMAVLLAADAFGVNPFKSFWSNFERMEGFVGHLHLFGYFVVLSAMVRSAEEYGRLFRAFIVSNVAVLVFAYGQLLGANGYIFSQLLPSVAAKFSAVFPIHMSENRLDATLGNSAYFAIYCLMFIFILALRWSQSRTPGKAFWYPALMLLNLIALFYTGTRGTQIGLLAGGFVTLVLIGWFEKGKARKIIVGTIITCAILVGSVFAFKDSSFIQSSPTLARFASISPNDITGMSRISIWKISYEAWKERPLLGYGQENFIHVFAERFTPEKMWQLEPWYDRSHNVFFDWLVATGIIGLIAHLSLYAVSFFLIWRKKGDMPFNERAILTGALIGYFVHNIFVFDNLLSCILFLFLLAYIAWRTDSRGGVHSGHAIPDDTMKSVYLPLVAIVFLVTFYFLTYRPLVVNKLLVRGIDISRLIQVEGMNFAQAVKVQEESFMKAIAMNTLGSEETREQFMQTIARVAQVTIPAEVSAEDRKASVDAINSIVAAGRLTINDSYERYKNDARMLSIYGSFLNTVNDGVAGERILAQAHVIAPKKQLISFDLVRAYLLQNKFVEAYALAWSTYELAPAYPDAMKIYLITSIYANKWNEARTNVASKQGAIPFDPNIISALVNTNQVPLAVQMLREFKAANPAYAGEIDAYISQLLAGQKK